MIFYLFGYIELAENLKRSDLQNKKEFSSLSILHFIMQISA